MKLLSFLKSNKKQIIDDPNTTITREKIILNKLFLKNSYLSFYQKINDALTPINKNGQIIEIGSGGGFIKKVIPNVKTSDILKLPEIDMQFSATAMPFRKNTINVFVMLNVFHHIAEVEKFLTQASNSLKKGGQIILIEPSNTLFGKFIYTYFHHEPRNPEAGWFFLSTGPLSGANSALPWIVFERDKKTFERKFPELKITKLEAHTPLQYLLSGGFTFPQLLPDSFYPLVNFLERILFPLNRYIGLFYTITIEKRG